MTNSLPRHRSEGDLRQKLQEGIDALERGDFIELKDDAAISRFVADHLRQSCGRIDAQQDNE